MSHSLVQVREMADRVLWIERGEIKMYGETEPVLAAYDAFVKSQKKRR
ncbi:Teichoic acids export ATP-binding protein TagH [Weissella viridescens]|uniref:Teichoic acids export ATP-binding protein TagH n=1 Tax=Weissella viridescens TaxID=1629 RepID=A0A380P800_WEIVI|nr:Teichoic acids export ATP-binding protein TagH [Weissella viridescens]